MDRLTRFPALWRFTYRLAYLIHQAGEQRSEAVKRQLQLRDDIAAGRLNRTIGDHYAGDLEKNKWLVYEEKFLLGAAENEVVFRNGRIRDEVAALRPTRFLNFGCLYGWLEDELGKSGIEAHGVDRSPETKMLNEKKFRNAKFYAAPDIFEFLEQRHDLTSGAMFAHINTGVYFLPKFLTKLYQTAYRGGIESILVWEPWGRSRIDLDYQQVDPDTDIPPKVYRGVMILHNYARLLQLAGYKNIVRREIVRPPHPHPDYRSVFLVATK
jgi:hypothetical protein